MSREASEDVVVCRVPHKHNADTETRIAVRARPGYSGAILIDVRYWTRFDDPDGEAWVPSKAGVTFNKDDLAEVLQALERAKTIAADIKARLRKAGAS